MNESGIAWTITGSLAAVILLNLVLSPSPAAYAAVLPLAIFIAVFFWTRSMDDRAFYLVLAGVLLVAVFSAATIWGGLAAAWLIALIVAACLKILLTRSGIRSLAIAAGATIAVVLLIGSQNHVLIPLAILCCATFCVLAVTAVRQYRFRKHYAGVDA